MRGRRALVILLVLLAALPLATGRPFASYARSGSMEPTIPTFGVFLVNPWPARIEPGDVVVFESLARGEPAVHRVVGGGSGGWYTKGDANPDVDQLAGEPPVTRDRILGKVVTGTDGEPLVLRDGAIPLVEAKARLSRLETVAGGPERVQAIGLVALAAVFTVLAIVAPPARTPSRAPRSPRWRRLARRALPRGVLGRHVGALLVVALLASGAWAAARSTTVVTSTVIVVQDPSAADSTRAAAPGGHVSRELGLGSLGLLPTLAVIEPGNARIDVLDPVVEIGVWERTSARYLHEGGKAVGAQEDPILVTRYPAFLPDEATLWLHAQLPGLPYLVVAGALALALWTWLELLGVLRLPVGRWLGLREGWL